MKLTSVSLLLILSLSLPLRTFACDLCGCYLPPQELVHAPAARASLYGGVAEQFTHFGTLQFNEREVDDPAHQHLESFITQLVAGVAFFEHRLSFQVNVPLIDRAYRRAEGFEIDRGHESGLGDVSLLANLVAWRRDSLFRESGGGRAEDGKTMLPLQRGEPDFSASFHLIAGVKLPTGDSRRLREEFNEVEVEGAPASGIHGHDLTLGTGSYDAIFGAQVFLRYRAVYFDAETQWTLRGDGLHSYHFANDLSWSGGPGVYLYRRAGRTLGLQGIASGESKDTDRFQGRLAEDTGLTSLYLGPRITAQFGGFGADVGVDLPVIMNTTKLQTVADYRIRGGLTIHF